LPPVASKQPNVISKSTALAREINTVRISS
jgi:hypothetical protein